MKAKTVSFFVVLLVLMAGSVVFAEQVSVESLSPSVVKTVPVCGDTAVDPALSEIRVTFSKDMMTKQMWSWCMHSKNTFPQVANPKGIRYQDDKRTCVLPVKLESGKTYVIWVNNQQNDAFRDTQGHSAVPYMLVFATK